MQRTTVGILSLALLVCGIVFSPYWDVFHTWAAGFVDHSRGMSQLLVRLDEFHTWVAGHVDLHLMSGILVRTGLVLGAIWLAMPQVKQLVAGLSPFGVVCAFLAIVLFAWRPRLLLYFVPVLLLLGLLHIAGWFTKPKQQSSSTSRSPSRRG